MQALRDFGQSLMATHKATACTQPVKYNKRINRLAKIVENKTNQKRSVTNGGIDSLQSSVARGKKFWIRPQLAA